jgi:hypothetical protein
VLHFGLGLARARRQLTTRPNPGPYVRAIEINFCPLSVASRSAPAGQFLDVNIRKTAIDEDRQHAVVTHHCGGRVAERLHRRQRG